MLFPFRDTANSSLAAPNLLLVLKARMIHTSSIIRGLKPERCKVLVILIFFLRPVRHWQE